MAILLLDEVHTQQEVRQELTNLWRTEVERYENSIGNQYNSTGTIQNTNYFPYHTALYPLLDCYDSVAIATNALYYRVSPTPMPNENNGHRRSRFSTTRRVDRYGVHIEELASLHEHLPNSAWAIRHLMPKNRRDQFDSYEAAATVASETFSMQSEPAMNNNRELENVDNNNDNLDNWNTPVRRDNYRFWNLIMDPVAETIPRSDISTPPNINDYEEEEDDDSGSWEDIDSNDDNGGEEILNVNDAVKYIAQGMHNIASNARDFTFLHWWQNIIIHERRGVVVIHYNNSISTTQNEEEEDSTIDGDIRYSPESLFAAYNHNKLFANAASPLNDPTMILLRVLKHSLSDLQRDFRLARAILLLIADWKLCDENDDYEYSSNIKEDASRVEEKMDNRSKDVVSSYSGSTCLRQLLTIISSEYIRKCNGNCHELYIADGGISDDDDDDEDDDYNSSSTRLHAPDHYCKDWWEFLGTLSTLLSEGITCITQSHANIICAFVVLELNHANTPDVSFAAVSGKEYLKRNLYFLNNAEQQDGTTRNTAEDGVTQDTAPFNNNLLLTIISAVRLHALSDRLRLVKLIDEFNCSDKEKQGYISVQLTRYLDSYRRCNNILVVIGERIALQLPCNIHSRQLGGMIVRGLVESFIGSDVLSSVHAPLSYLGQQNVRLRSLIDPRRYADAVLNSSNHPLLDPSRKDSDSNTIGKCSFESLIGIQPPVQVVDTVKALFTADLVDLQVSGCGYGDFLIWCNLPVSPEPILFDYISNFPNLRDMDEAFDNIGSTSEEWCVDEDGIELDYAHLSARYDFSLLVLLRQWHAPWSSDSHFSFSIPFRRSVSTMALCAHRFGVPHDIVAMVNSYLPRSWWPDDRRCCWCRDCQMNTMKNQSSQSRDGQSRLRSERKEKNLITCAGCQVAMVCFSLQEKLVAPLIATHVVD